MTPRRQAAIVRAGAVDRAVTHIDTALKELAKAATALASIDEAAEATRVMELRAKLAEQATRIEGTQ